MYLVTYLYHYEQMSIFIPYVIMKYYIIYFAFAAPFQLSPTAFRYVSIFLWVLPYFFLACFITLKSFLR